MKLDIFEKLNDASLSRSEFTLLPFLSRKYYEQTAKERFSMLDSHIDKNHVDWNIRIQSNTDFASLLGTYIKSNLSEFNKKKRIKLIELGSSLGAITTLFALKEITSFGLLDKVDIWLLDIYKKGLDETKKLKFNIELILDEAKFGNDSDRKLLKTKLKSASIIKANILNLPQNLPHFDIVLSGFAHHHLNIYDKKIACLEMERITKKGAIISVGDLFFSYSSFIKWLKKHRNEINEKSEKIPYAIESFIPIKTHINLFEKSDFLFQILNEYYYCFCLVKK